ncbi:MAG: hypothetical protein U1B80_05515, partial [Anaerolineaceae bacterium]|nr:hypothetical protein [Anaerolineaceae bacterium]
GLVEPGDSFGLLFPIKPEGTGASVLALWVLEMADAEAIPQYTPLAAGASSGIRAWIGSRFSAFALVVAGSIWTSYSRR